MAISRKYLDEVRKKALNNPLILDKQNIRKTPFKAKENYSWIPADCWHEKLLIFDISGKYIENSECKLREGTIPEKFNIWLKNNYPKCHNIIKKQEEKQKILDTIHKKRVSLGHPIT